MLTVTAAAWLVALGIGFGFLLTRLARGVAARVGLVDSPDLQRKTQSRPVPIAGGIAVLAAAILALTVTSFFVSDVSAGLAAQPGQTFGMLAAAILIVVVGL